MMTLIWDKSMWFLMFRLYSKLKVRIKNHAIVGAKIYVSYSKRVQKCFPSIDTNISFD